MEAIDPGRLERIVRRAISPFRDRGLRTRAWEVAQEAQENLDEHFEEECADELSELYTIEEEAQAISGRSQETLVEEENTDQLLSELAEDAVNPAAAA